MVDLRQLTHEICVGNLKRDAGAFDAVEGWANRGVNLAGANEPVRATASFVTGGMLPMLGVPPALGRVLTPEDDKPNAPLTAVLSYGLWQRGYGGNATVLRGPWGAMLIDAGFGPRATDKRLGGTGLSITDLSAICLTHLDHDHFNPNWLATIVNAACSTGESEGSGLRSPSSRKRRASSRCSW